MIRTTSRLAAVGAAAFAGLLATACSSGGKSSTTPAPTPGGVLVSVATSPLGSILVDAHGKTIYGFAIDKPGRSACTGTCLQYWPIVPAPDSIPMALPGVAAKLGALSRPDGKRQLTIAGLPAYTFSGDSGPGMTSGQGKDLSGGLWWVVSPSGSWITTGPAPSSSSGGGGYY